MSVHAAWFVTRARGLSEGDFADAWLAAPVGAEAAVPGLEQYLRCRRIRGESDEKLEAPVDRLTKLEAPFDTLLETRHATLDAFRAFRDVLRETWSVAGSPADADRLQWLVTTEHVIKDAGDRSGLVDVFFAVKRHPDMPVSEFRDYWLNVHGPVARDEMPGLLHYSQWHAVDEAYEYGTPRWDGCAHMFFAEPADWQRVLSSEYLENFGYPDSAKFNDFSLPAPTMMVKEIDVLAPQE